jgi:hypothetical protein
LIPTSDLELLLKACSKSSNFTFKKKILDTDEPLLSGSGNVSKEVKDCNLLEAWAEMLTRWHGNLAMRPKQVTGLVRKGIPEALRGEVWQLLAGVHDSAELLEAYRILITKASLEM